jgi:hypothetical protein
MSHWAQIDENNIVIRVLVGDNNDPRGDEGYQWIIENFGGRWIQTSYNSNFRKNFAGVGFTYNETLDAFIPPKIYSSWVLVPETATWEPPVSKPTDQKNYTWDEVSQSWTELLPE